MASKKPRVIIIGAGMAGISAAQQLYKAKESSCKFDVTILEASHRIGGRIRTAEIGDDRVELGATWIHGIEGSPLYKLAQDMGALLQKDKPFECQNGFPEEPIVKAEGGHTVESCVLHPVMLLYKKLLVQIRSMGEGELPSSAGGARSIGAFVRNAFDEFLYQQQQDNEEQLINGLPNWDQHQHQNHDIAPWTLSSLQEALITLNENMERITTSANTLFDLDAHAEKEYTDYPGEHITIASGYSAIVDKLASPLPQKIFYFGKIVEKIEWGLPLTASTSSPVLIHCTDGSVYEADHVIVTVSLGVLKAGIKHDYADEPRAKPEGRLVSRSIDDLQGGVCKKNSSLFEPPLPLSKLEAISRLGYGVVDKLFLKLNTDALSPSQLQHLNSHIQLVYNPNVKLDKQGIPWWMRRTFSIAPIYKGSSVLLCWFAGGEALEMETLSDEEIMRGVSKTLASFGVAKGCDKVGDEYSSSGSDSEDSVLRHGEVISSSSDSEENFDDDGDLTGGKVQEPEHGSMFNGVLRSKWGRDPLFNGSYSFVATGASGDDIEKLAEPLPIISENLRDVEAPLQLLFAGEATERNFYSTTHGAHLSGLREATRLLCHYDASSSLTY